MKADNINKASSIIACERKRISRCRFSPPLFFGGMKRQQEIRLRLQAMILGARA